MNNMQILHECRDSRDDHFAERRTHIRHAVNSGRHKRRETQDDFSGEDITEEMILDHLETLTTRFSLKKAASNEAILECISYAEEAGLYNSSSSPDIVMNDAERPSEDFSGPHGTHLAHDTYVEDVWEKTYDDRREQYKRNASVVFPFVRYRVL
ncbi:hypothetical protein B0H14DRAFT_2626154 [Mycena olivaceomarginata]|nr:hypothetical protein B0H14DRAFT_2626154 [Mycena olivaceomarginata]